MKVTLIDYTQDPVSAIEEAASNCYQTDLNTIAKGKLMKNCYDSGHWAVLEFAHFHFRIEGISRACSLQLVRHRLASYAMRSQRYCDESNFEYITPPSIKDANAIGSYDYAMFCMTEFYRGLNNITKIPQEDARFVLPNSCATVIDVDMNLRELINFMSLRLCTRAQWEIRQVAQKMRKAVIEICPLAEEMLVPKCERGKIKVCSEHKSCGKHITEQELQKTLYDTLICLNNLSLKKEIKGTDQITLNNLVKQLKRL